MTRIFIVIMLLVFSVVSASAHPGRLDEDGCHHVRKNFVYSSGRVVLKGDYHCHRLLVGKPATLDGREVLGERGDEHAEDKEDASPEAH
ncbi:MAG TPA: hypothetical protein DCQ64_19180 [Candidatus Rokubacteria bacterium]|nr:hypothetical protein [Candidatus Rokubacteria bacterium]